MTDIIKGYLKYIIPGIIILALLGGLWWAWHHQYTTGYDAGIAAQKSAQDKANNEARLNNEAEKTRLERVHAAELAAANVDAATAAAAVDRLRGQLSEIRRVALDHPELIPAGAPAGNTVVLLTNMLAKSLERSRDLAAYADSARLAGQLCERQYDSLTQK